VQLEGRVLLGATGDSVPLPGRWVVLHEVTMGGGGPVDSLRTGADGGFRLRRARPDTAALYMASTTYRGITYFSQVVTGRDTTARLEPLVVYDTSSAGPQVLVAQRHIVVRRGANARSVLELVALANDGQVTRVTGDPPHPTWVGRLPEGATGFVVGQSDVSSEAVQVVGDSIVLTAAVPPGVKQLVYSYDVPAEDELRLPLDQPVERIIVLLQDTAAVQVEGPLTKRGVQVFNDVQFAMFDGSAPTAGGAMVFRFTGSPFSMNTVVIVVAGLAALLLLVAIPLLRRTTPEPLRARPPETPEELARAIAVLDAQHEGQADRSPEAEARYQAERTALKQRLSDLLARQRSGA